MKSINRLLILVLVVSLILPCIGVSAEKKTEISSEATELLTALEFYDPEVITDFNAVVTRSQFARFAAKLVYLGDPDTIVLGNLPFEDVTEDQEFYGAISLLYNLGAISGVDDTHFDPDGIIAPEHAVKILLKIMGYDYLYKLSGSYFKAAQEKNLLKSLYFDNASDMTYAEALTLAYNVLMSDITSYNVIDGKPTSDGNETYLEKRLKIYPVSGIVSDDGKTSIYGETDIKSGYVKIGDNEYLNKTTHTELLGKYVTGYYKFDSEEDSNVLISAYVRDSKNDVLTIKAENILSFKDNKYKYKLDSTDDMDFEAQLSDPYDFIYNGRAVEPDQFDEKYLKPTYGSVTLIDNNGDGTYEIVNVYSYVTYIVGSINPNDKVIYSYREVRDQKLDLGSSNIKYRILDNLGKEVAFSAIRELDVLSVAKSIDDKNYDITVSQKKFTGTVEQIGNGEYVINGGTYYATNTADTDNLKVGNSATFYLDHLGNIAYFSSSISKSITIAYLISMGNDKRGVSDEVKLKVMTQTGAITTLTCNSSVNIDGVKKKTPADIVSAVGSTEQLIRYKVDDKSLITWIDTKEIGSEDESINLLQNAAGNKPYYANNSSFNADVAIDSNSIIFNVASPFDDDVATIYSKSQLSDAASYAILPYRIGDKVSMYADAIVVKKNSTFDGYDDTSSRGFIERVVEVYDADECENKYKINVNVSGSTQEYYTANTEDITYKQTNNGVTVIKTLAPGDYITFKLDDKKRFVAGKYIVVYDCDEDCFVSSTSGITNWRATARLAYDYVYNIQDGMFQITPCDLSTLAEDESPTDVKILSQNAPIIYRFSRSSNKATKISISDIKTYLSVGNDCDRMLYYSRYGVLRSIIVYED